MADLALYKLIYSDEFATLSIGENPGPAWCTQLPVPPFGNAAFMPFSSGLFTQETVGGKLCLGIRVRHNPVGGALQGGLISTHFLDGSSRLPNNGGPFGYFEARLWLPTGTGIWPAFWGIESERLSATRDHVYELDGMEHYGTALPDRFSSHVHDWNWNNTTLEGHTSEFIQKVVGTGVLATGWHRYGVEITPQQIHFSFDGVNYWTSPTPLLLTTPLIWMINLGAGGGWPIDPALDAKLYVDYFRAYARRSRPKARGHKSGLRLITDFRR